MREGLRTTHTLDELNNVREPSQQAINVKDLFADAPSGARADDHFNLRV
jgi:hypothetical protein